MSRAIWAKLLERRQRDFWLRCAPTCVWVETAASSPLPAAAPDLSSMAKTPSTQASTARAEAQSSSESPREKAAEAVVLPMAPPVIHPKRAPPVVLSEQELDDHLREFGRENQPPFPPSTLWRLLGCLSRQRSSSSSRQEPAEFGARDSKEYGTRNSKPRAPPPPVSPRGLLAHC